MLSSVAKSATQSTAKFVAPNTYKKVENLNKMAESINNPTAAINQAKDQAKKAVLSNVSPETRNKLNQANTAVTSAYHTTMNSDEKHSGFIGPLTHFVKSLLSKGLTFGITLLGNALDIPTADVMNNPDSLIDRFNEALKTPETRAKLSELAQRIGQQGSIIIDSVAPPVKEALVKAIDIGEVGFTKIGQSGVKAVMDVVGVIPGVGRITGLGVACAAAAVNCL